MHIDALTIIELIIAILVIITIAEQYVGYRTQRRASKSTLLTSDEDGLVRIEPNRCQCVWLQASCDSGPAMSLSGQWRVTNLTGENINFRRAFITHPHAEGEVMLIESGQRGIAAGSSSEIITHFWIQPAVRRPGDHLLTTVVFVDQRSNSHIVTDIDFKYWSG